MKCWTQAKLALPAGGRAVDPALVVAQQLAAPVAVVDGRIGQDVVRLEVREGVGVEAVAPGDVGADAADGEVHVGQTPGGVVGLLAVDADVADSAAMLLDELLAADEHPTRTAAWVVNAALVRRQHLDEHADDARGRVELAT